MTKVKLPEPFRKQGQQIAFDCCDRAQADYFVSAQLKQYGDDRAREALEMAALKFETQHAWLTNALRDSAASLIRALAKGIK